MGIEDAVYAEIRKLRENLPHVAGVVVASVDGLLVTHDAPGVQAETFAAMSAAHLGLSQQIAAAAGSGAFRETVVRAATGYVASFAAGDAALMTVLAGPELNVGRLQHEARPVAERVGEIFASAGLG
ncbi:roadblock/LC7 domain-containing protein [Hamadaea tsunoensis]|uniref:roadblock/LC7 domain-containing protein n=1 Tax=Hamadaea tsunoensis TaxID=53368 RepID=UPI00040A3078|nr:roadblock/LC7 domain-containing protein [Hamadaea tsunoensis]